MILLLRTSLVLLPVGTVEGTDGEIKEYGGDRSIHQELPVLRAREPCDTQAQGVLDKEEAEDGEEHASDLEPQHAARVDEGPPDGFAEALGSASCSGSRLDAARDMSGGLLANGLRGLGSAVTQHSRRDAQTYAEPATYTVRFHTMSLTAMRFQF